jgi:IS4 transposase
VETDLCELLWRIKNNTRLPVEKALPDDSWLSTIYADAKARRAKHGGMRVRVIEYRLQGSDAPDEKYLLITTLLEHEKHPASALAALYPQRWEIETAYDEFKTHLRGGSVVLRSKTPELVAQEFYGFMLAHYSVRELMHQAALANDIDPDRLSFTHSIEVIKRKLPAYKVGFSPSEDAPAPTTDNP